jgi:hypothetical protein
LAHFVKRPEIDASLGKTADEDGSSGKADASEVGEGVQYPQQESMVLPVFATLISDAVAGLRETIRLPEGGMAVAPQLSCCVARSDRPRISHEFAY